MNGLGQWLTRLFSSFSGPPSGGRGGLPSLDVVKRGALAPFSGKFRGQDGKIPNAALIYGISSAVLLSIALYYLFTGLWFTALLLIILGGALFGYALHFLSYPTQ
jgi:hypothetical protein